MTSVSWIKSGVEMLLVGALAGSLAYLVEVAEPSLGFPFAIKSTIGKKAREVWSPKTREELAELVERLRGEEKQGKRFFAQAFTVASQRTRVFVLGGRAFAAITRPTKWRKRFLEVDEAGEYPEGEKMALHPIPKEDAELAVAAANVVGLDIAGVDIAQEDKTGKRYVWEVNAAPAWGAVAKDTGLNIEEEILKFLASTPPQPSSKLEEGER